MGATISKQKRVQQSIRRTLVNIFGKERLITKPITFEGQPFLEAYLKDKPRSGHRLYCPILGGHFTISTKVGEFSEDRVVNALSKLSAYKADMGYKKVA